MKTLFLTAIVLFTSTANATHSALTFKHRESQGVGYNQGYSTLDYYLTSTHDKMEFLFNLRGHLFNNAKAAANGGLGFRYSLNEDSSRIGANAYYDVRDTDHFVANQIGAGLEWMSRTADVRLNGYLPVGNKGRFSQHKFQGFTQYQALIKRKFTGALPCVEGEVGTSLAAPFYFAAGTYYLFVDKSHSIPLGKVWGWKARLDIEMGDYFTVGGLVTRDAIFKTRIQGYLSLHIPLGPWKAMKDGSPSLEKRPIIRNEIIPIQSKKKSKHPLTSSDGTSITRFLFVNNTAPSYGNGTFEKPFTSLKEAEINSQPGDIIYVYPGDGSPRHMNEGIILKDQQLLASSGAPLEIKDVEIPAQTPGQSPTITNIHLNEPVITNPGKTKMSNFFYMNPWEYTRLYEYPFSHSFSMDDLTKPSSEYMNEAPIPSATSKNAPETPLPPVEASLYDDPALSDWVDVSKEN